MKSIVLGGLTGAFVCLIMLAVAGAAVCFCQGTLTGYEGSKPPYTLGAASLGAVLFVLNGGLPAAILGLVVGSVVGNARQYRGHGTTQDTLPRGPIWLGAADIVLGLAPFLLTGLILATETHRLVDTNEWLFLLGQIEWFTTGLLLAAIGVRRLIDAHEPLRTALVFRICCSLSLVALALWGHLYVTQSPSDPSGALKSAAHVLLVGSPVVLLGYLMWSMWYLRLWKQLQDLE